AKQRIRVTVIKFKIPDPPAALSVRGELQVGGNTYIDSRADTSCGAKMGTFTTGITTVLDNSADVYGADGNNSRNESTDIVQLQPTAAFDSYLLTDSDMAALKAYAKSQGTYYQGAVEFSASNTMPNGIIFVDTVSGNPMTASSDPNDQANLTIHGNAPASSDGIFHGWLIVNGRLEISGNFQMWGYGYVINDLTYPGTGTGQIVGAMLSRNIQDTSSTTIDTNTGGNASILYDCAKARNGGGAVPQTYAVKGGTYREVSEECAGARCSWRPRWPCASPRAAILPRPRRRRRIRRRSPQPRSSTATILGRPPCTGRPSSGGPTVSRLTTGSASPARICPSGTTPSVSSSGSSPTARRSPSRSTRRDAGSSRPV